MPILQSIVLKFKQYKYYQEQPKQDKKIKIEYVFLRYLRINQSTIISSKLDGSVSRLKKSLMIFKSLSQTSRSNKQKEDFFPSEAEHKFGLQYSPIYQKTLLKGKQKISNGYLIRLIECIHYQLYVLIYLDSLTDSCCKRSIGKSSKEKKIVLVILANISSKKITQSF